MPNLHYDVSSTTAFDYNDYFNSSQTCCDLPTYITKLRNDLTSRYLSCNTKVYIMYHYNNIS